LEDLRVDGKVLKYKLQKLKNLKEIGRESVDWIYLAQNRDMLLAVVNEAMNLQFPQKAGNFLIR
jgi:hypothetical protein